MSFSRTAALAFALAFALPFVPFVAPVAQALPKSVNIAMVGSEGSENGGGLFHADAAFTGMSFTDVSPAAITDEASLAGFDTVVLHVASTQMGCTTNPLSPAAKSALNGFVGHGGKMIIHDSECTFGGAVDYSWLPYPFSTTNPGAGGLTGGSLIDLEENTLSCSNPSDPCFVDLSTLASGTDGVGDSNVVVTQDVHWCADLKAVNGQGAAGYNHMYAHYGTGFYVYNGMDEDFETEPSDTSGGGQLAKIWLLELLQPWNASGLPCAHPVVCDGHPIVITVTLDDPFLNFDYFNGQKTPQTPVPLTMPRVVGPMTITATSSDPLQTISLDFYVDGNLRSSDTSAPYSYFWDPAAEPVEEGVHTLVVKGTSTNVNACPAIASREVLVPAFSQEARSIALFVGNALPEAGDVEARGALSGAASGHDNRTVIDQTVTVPTQMRVRVANDTADTDRASGTQSATASSVVGRVDIPALGIMIESLRSDASVSLGRATFATTSSGTAFVLQGVVSGQPIGGPMAPDTTIAIPGGHVIFNEQILDASPGHIELTVNAMHVYTDDGLVRDEIIFGQSHAAVDLMRGSFSGAPREMTPQNDAGIGGDASDSFAFATPMPYVVTDGSGHGEAILAGKLGGDDTADYYAIPVVPGQKLQATLIPGDGVHVSLTRIHADPLDGEVGYSADLTAIRMKMLEPGTASVRADALVADFGLPQHEELNVDVAGAWVLVVYHDGGAVANYTLSATITPLELLADDQVSGPDAGSTCASAATPTTEVVPGVLHETDPADVWAVHADIGDVLSAAIKPTEDVDGANFDLILYDTNCAFVVASSFGTGLTPKGTPDAVTLDPVPVTGTYFVEVRRISGIGNYYLDLRATKPIPTIPQDDALSGVDAPASGCPGLMLPARGVYQGTMPDADAADSYSFTVAAGERIAMGILAQPGSSFGWTLRSPTCNVVQSGATALGVGDMVFGPVSVAGTYTVTFTHGSGGGNYMFAIANK